MNHTHRLKTRIAAAVAVAVAVSACPAMGADFDLAGGQLSVKGSLSFGTAYRTKSQDTDLRPMSTARWGITGAYRSSGING